MFVPRANKQNYDTSSIGEDRSLRQGINLYGAWIRVDPLGSGLIPVEEIKIK